MLRHEPQEEIQNEAVLQAGQRRVTPEELTTALEALESGKQEQARQVQQTVAISDVVQELGLNVTPEEVWEQVQAQRAQKAATPPPAAESKLADTVNDTLHAAAQQAHKIAGQASAAAAATYVAAQAARPRRQAKRRGPLGVMGIAIALGVVGTTLFNSGHGVVVTSDHATQTYTGNRGTAIITGDNDTIVLRGNCDTLTVLGDYDHITVTGIVKHIITPGDHNTIASTQDNRVSTPSITDTGDGNKITTIYDANPADLEAR